MRGHRKFLTLLAAALTAAFLWWSPPQAKAASSAEFNKGLTAYNMGKFGMAALIWGRMADQGSAIAQSSLGLLYYTGSGVPTDYDRARELFLAAAQKNVPEAQMFLSLMYRRGDGVRQSWLLSYMWCDIAVGAGHEAASYVRLGLAEHLTGPEVLEAQRLSSEWRQYNIK